MTTVMSSAVDREQEIIALKERNRELLAALNLLLYGGYESNSAMTPAGDKFTVVYPRGTLAKVRAAIKPQS